MDDCVFCRISNGDVSVNRIYENDSFLSFPDSSPKVEGHSLVISKKHFKTILDLPSSSGQELLDCIKNTALKLLEVNKAGGFNVVSNNFPVAGQAVHHVHYHILARKEGAGVKVIG